MGEEIDNNIDILITVGKEAENIANNAKAKEIFMFKTNDEAILKLKESILKNDAILVKASNGMHFNEIVNAIV